MTTSRSCAVPNCENPYYGRGYCNPHWQMWRLNGDPLVRKKPRGDAAKFYREIVLTHDKDECLLWPYSMHAGYGGITIGGKRMTINRLVCEAEHGPAPSPYHKASSSCSNKQCVARKHWSWKPPLLTPRKARNVLLLKGKLSKAKIAKKYGVSVKTVKSIHQGRIWGKIQDPEPHDGDTCTEGQS